MRPFLFDAFCVIVIAVLLARGLLPRELGAGLLGAIVGVRARGPIHEGPSGPDVPRQPPTVGGRLIGDPIARGVLEESALGQLFHWSRWALS